MLGYIAASWESTASWDDPPPSSVEKGWTDMTPAQRDAARVLGYNRTTWDDDSGREPQPESDNKDWAELTENERAAAKVFGYTEASWDNEPPASLYKYWNSLTRAEKDAVAVLGWTETTWDNDSGDEEQPAAYAQFWAELTDTEKAAAAVLGFTEKKWDSSNPRPTPADKPWAQLTACGADRPPCGVLSPRPSERTQSPTFPINHLLMAVLRLAIILI